MSAPERSAVQYQYAVLRIVPRVERGECFNAGVVLICRARRYLAARVYLDTTRLAALAPDLDPATVQAHLDALAAIAAGDPAAGPLARLTQAERFHWLTAPASTLIQPAPSHTGLCTDPAAALDRLFAELVLPPAPAAGGAHGNAATP